MKRLAVGVWTGELVSGSNLGLVCLDTPQLPPSLITQQREVLQGRHGFSCLLQQREVLQGRHGFPCLLFYRRPKFMYSVPWYGVS